MVVLNCYDSANGAGTRNNVIKVLEQEVRVLTVYFLFIKKLDFR